MREFLPILSVLFLLASPVVAQDSFELKQTQDEIHFKAVNQPLSKVLQSIGQKSGVAFFMREELYETPVTATIDAPDWKALVTALLADFSKVEMWSKNIAGSKIRILGLGDYVPDTAAAPATKTAKAAPLANPKEDPALKSSHPRKTRKRRERPPPPPKPEELYPDHPLAKLPSHVFMEPAITNYLLESKVDIPPEFKKKYGLSDGSDEEGEGSYMRERKSYPIPKEIYEDPAFDEYLSAVGLSKPPQIPEGFVKIDPNDMSESRKK